MVKVQYLDMIVNYKELIQDNTKVSISKDPTAWIQTLFHNANKICCSKPDFQQQIDHIKTLMSWNAYPKYVVKSIINRLKSNANRNDNININKDDRKVIWIHLPYLGRDGEQLTNSRITKPKRDMVKHKLRDASCELRVTS